MRIQHQTARSTENFPVASWLLPKQNREIILIFYDFVRGLDDLADDGSQPAEARYQALIHIEQSLEHGQVQSMPPFVARYAKACAQRRIHPAYGAKLIQAFKQDTQQSRYETWQDLLDYCQLSAAPVGQFMLEVCGETGADIDAADALCTVLQLLNHLQDMKTDLETLNRIYWPREMMLTHGIEEGMLCGAYSNNALRSLMNDVLSHCETMLQTSEVLMSTIRSRRLRVEVGWIHAVATMLCVALKQRDPLASRVTLPKWRYGYGLLCALRWLY